MKPNLPEPELQIVEMPATPSLQEREDAFWRDHATIKIDDLVKSPRNPGKPN
jgi:hypothetical protein